jgi:hypothetical protein
MFLTQARIPMAPVKFRKPGQIPTRTLVRCGFNARSTSKSIFDWCRRADVHNHGLAPCCVQQVIVPHSRFRAESLVDVNGQFQVPAGGHEKSPPLERELLLL